jgi:hypothetical protein
MTHCPNLKSAVNCMAAEGKGSQFRWRNGSSAAANLVTWWENHKSSRMLSHGGLVTSIVLTLKLNKSYDLAHHRRGKLKVQAHSIMALGLPIRRHKEPRHLKPKITLPGIMNPMIISVMTLTNSQPHVLMRGWCSYSNLTWWFVTACIIPLKCQEYSFFTITATHQLVLCM